LKSLTLIFDSSYVVELYPKSLLPAGIGNPIAPEQFFQNAQLLLDIFTINSYSIAATITDVSSSTPAAPKLLQITMKLPATLWSLQVLKSEKQPLVNDFELKLLDAYARSSGLSLKCRSSIVTNRIDLNHIVELSPT
jgi:hypothetical protein